MSKPQTYYLDADNSDVPTFEYLASETRQYDTDIKVIDYAAYEEKCLELEKIQEDYGLISIMIADIKYKTKIEELKGQSETIKKLEDTLQSNSLRFYDALKTYREKNQTLEAQLAQWKIQCNEYKTSCESAWKLNETLKAELESHRRGHCVITIEKLQKENDLLSKHFNGLNKHAVGLEAEIEKLRGAIEEQHLNWGRNDGSCTPECTDTCKALETGGDE